MFLLKYSCKGWEYKFNVLVDNDIEKNTSYSRCFHVSLQNWSVLPRISNWDAEFLLLLSVLLKCLAC